MSGQRTFGERLKELRIASGLKITNPGARKPENRGVADRLRSMIWHDMEPADAAERVSAWESGEVYDISRAECRQVEMIVGATPGELWNLALQDPRKLDPEILDYFVGLLRERADDTESPPSRAALRALAHFGKE